MAVLTPTGEELRMLAANHLAEAQALALLDAGFFSGSWYLAGYAVECALKAVICRTLSLAEYPDKVFKGNLKSHNFRDLVILSGVSQELVQRQADVAFEDNWDVVSTWDPQDRYLLSRTRQQAEGILAALTDPQNGVFTWLSSRW